MQILKECRQHVGKCRVVSSLKPTWIVAMLPTGAPTCRRHVGDTTHHVGKKKNQHDTKRHYLLRTCAKSKDDDNVAHPFTFGASSNAFLLWVWKNWPFGCPYIPPDLFLIKNGSHFYIFGSFLPIFPFIFTKTPSPPTQTHQRHDIRRSI